VQRAGTYRPHHLRHLVRPGARRLSLVPGLLAALAGLAALGVAAAAIAWRLRLGQPRLDVLGWAFLTVHLCTLTVLLHGLAGTLRPGPLLATALLAGAAGALALARDRAARGALRAGVSELGQAARRRPWLAGALVLVALLQLAREVVHVVLLPPYVWDTLTYHLPRLPEWIQAGRLTVVDTPSLRTHWPAGHELLQLWLAVFPRHDAFVEAAGIPFHAMAAASVYAIARGLGQARATAAVAAAAFACVPAVALQATSAKNDLPIAAAFLFLAALAVDLRAQGGGLRWRHLGWMLLVLGSALGTKPTIVFLVPALLVLMPWRTAGPVAPERPSHPGLWAAVLASALLVGLFWYGRNAAVFGDPFYPTNLKVGGELLFEGEKGRGQQGGASLEGLGRNLRMARRKVMDERGPYTAELQDIAGWGWFTFALGPPSLLYALFRWPRSRRVAAAFAAGLLGVFLMVAPDPWNMRFVAWFPALAALSFGATLSVAGGPPRAVLLALAALATGLDVVGSLGGSLQDPAAWRAMARLPLERRSSAELGRAVPYIGPGFAETLAAAPAEEPVGYHTHKDGGIYPLYGADYRRRVVYVPIEVGEDPAAAMRARGVRHLHVTHERVVVRQMLDRAVAAGSLRKVGDTLYALAR
jgi:4-amino-4-deoxy-L-arabinose transferase-like glycosyltransferase